MGLGTPVTAITATSSPLEVVTVNLSDLIALPDAEAASTLDIRLGAWDRIDALHERGFAERGIIIREFEKRQLWRHLISPVNGEPFPHLTAWLSCAGRRTNFEAKRVVSMLEDIPAEKLIDVPKGNLSVLTQLSTQVRNAPDVLEAAKTMKRQEFEAKIEREHPQQHIEERKPVRFHFGRSQLKAIEEWIEYALENDLAGTREEAVMRACEVALDDAKLDAELREMPDEVRA